MSRSTIPYLPSGSFFTKQRDHPHLWLPAQRPAASVEQPKYQSQRFGDSAESMPSPCPSAGGWRSLKVSRRRLFLLPYEATRDSTSAAPPRCLPSHSLAAGLTVQQNLIPRPPLFHGVVDGATVRQGQVGEDRRAKRLQLGRRHVAHEVRRRTGAASTARGVLLPDDERDPVLIQADSVAKSRSRRPRRSSLRSPSSSSTIMSSAGCRRGARQPPVRTGPRPPRLAWSPLAHDQYQACISSPNVTSRSFTSGSCRSAENICWLTLAREGLDANPRPGPGSQPAASGGPVRRGVGTAAACAPSRPHHQRHLKQRRGTVDLAVSASWVANQQFELGFPAVYLRRFSSSSLSHVWSPVACRHLSRRHGLLEQLHPPASRSEDFNRFSHPP